MEHKKLTVIFDAENIQLQAWYKHCKYTFIKRFIKQNKRHSAFMAHEQWAYADKISVYCKHNERRVNKGWNSAVRAIEVNSRTSQAADNHIVLLVQQLGSKDKAIVITNDKELFRRCHEGFSGTSIRQYHFPRVEPVCIDGSIVRHTEIEKKPRKKKGRENGR